MKLEGIILKGNKIEKDKYCLVYRWSLKKCLSDFTETQPKWWLWVLQEGGNGVREVKGTKNYK